MKKQILIIVALLISSVLYSQIDTNFNTTDKRQKQLVQTSIELEVNVLADMRSVSDSISISLMYNGYQETISGPNKFKLYLKYDIDYYVQISCKGYTAKILRVDTRGARKAEWILQANVSLIKSSADACYVGGFAYQDNKFKKIH